MNNFEPERLSASSLKSAIYTVSPCEKHACENRDRCIKEKLACKAYRKYIETGMAPKPEKPSRVIHLRIYGC